MGLTLPYLTLPYLTLPYLTLPYTLHLIPYTYNTATVTQQLHNSYNSYTTVTRVTQHYRCTYTWNQLKKECSDKYVYNLKCLNEFNMIVTIVNIVLLENLTLRDMKKVIPKVNLKLERMKLDII